MANDASLFRYARFAPPTARDEGHATMVIHVQPDTETAIREKVERGEYRDADDVIRAALRVLEDQEIRQSVAEGLAAIERGEGIVLTQEVWEEITREADELARSGRPLRPHVCP